MQHLKTYWSCLLTEILGIYKGFATILSRDGQICSLLLGGQRVGVNKFCLKWILMNPKVSCFKAYARQAIVGSWISPQRTLI